MHGATIKKKLYYKFINVVNSQYWTTIKFKASLYHEKSIL